MKEFVKSDRAQFVDQSISMHTVSSSSNLSFHKVSRDISRWKNKIKWIIFMNFLLLTKKEIQDWIVRLPNLLSFGSVFHFSISSKITFTLTFFVIRLKRSSRLSKSVFNGRVGAIKYWTIFFPASIWFECLCASAHICINKIACSWAIGSFSCSLRISRLFVIVARNVGYSFQSSKRFALFGMSTR